MYEEKRRKIEAVSQTTPADRSYAGNDDSIGWIVLY